MNKKNEETPKQNLCMYYKCKKQRGRNKYYCSFSCRLKDFWHDYDYKFYTVFVYIGIIFIVLIFIMLTTENNPKRMTADEKYENCMTYAINEESEYECNYEYEMNQEIDEFMNDFDPNEGYDDFQLGR